MIKNNKFLGERKLCIGAVRLSYPHLFRRHSVSGNEAEGKYSACILIPKTETEVVANIRKAIERAAAEKWPGKNRPRFKHPTLCDGDERGGEGYEGCWYLNASSRTRPQVVDTQQQPILDEDAIYGGVWAIVSIEFFGYDTQMNKGVACGLVNVMKVRDGEPFGGGASSAADDFADVELDDPAEGFDDGL